MAYSGKIDMKGWLHIAMTGFMLCLASILPGQEDLRPATLENSQWDQLIEDRNYDQASQEAEPIDMNPSMPTMDAGWVKYVLIFILILVLVLLLIRVLGVRSNQKLKPLGTQMTALDRAEEHLPSADLLSLLEQALALKDYRSALRLHYLLALQELDAMGWIRHGKEKTNMAYVMELDGKEIQGEFRVLTRVSEFVWYGDRVVKGGDYQSLSPRFKTFMDDLKRP